MQGPEPFTEVPKSTASLPLDKVYSHGTNASSKSADLGRGPKVTFCPQCPLHVHVVNHHCVNSFCYLHIFSSLMQSCELLAVIELINGYFLCVRLSACAWVGLQYLKHNLFDTWF